MCIYIIIQKKSMGRQKKEKGEKKRYYNNDDSQKNAFIDYSDFFETKKIQNPIYK